MYPIRSLFSASALLAVVLSPAVSAPAMAAAAAQGQSGGMRGARPVFQGGGGGAGALGRRKGALGGQIAVQRLKQLDEMTPERRRKWLDSLPQERRERVERQLERYQAMKPDERARLSQQYERLFALKPAERRRLRQLYAEFDRLPDDRRPVVRGELRKLRGMSDEDRRTRLDSGEFHNRFSAGERQLLTDISDLLGPDAPAADDQNE